MCKRIFLLSILISTIYIVDFFVITKTGQPYENKNRRDPFVSLVREGSRYTTGLKNIQSFEDLSLEGIVYDSKDVSMAIINGVIVKEGEMVNDIHIVKIMPTTILVEINGMEETLYLKNKKE